jgi:hypothetical protein
MFCDCNPTRPASTSATHFMKRKGTVELRSASFLLSMLSPDEAHQSLALFVLMSKPLSKKEKNSMSALEQSGRMPCVDFHLKRNQASTTTTKMRSS